MNNKKTYIIASLLLAFVLVITVLSIKDDALTMDEQAHLPAGYSYLTQRDMRLNPEHPPLMKDISALPLLFIKDINFPYEAKSWAEDVNGQWDFGDDLLFKNNNPAGLMIFLGRLPMILILLILGFYVFLWTKQIFGNKSGLLALFLYSFSPTLLAHGRLVTTDVAAAAGVFIATYYLIKFLQNPSKKNIIIAGIILGIAQLLKFSVILLLPFFGIIVLIWAIVNPRDSAELSKIKGFFKTFWWYFIRCALIGLIALVIIWVVYQFHTLQYPPERQLSDTQTILKDLDNNLFADLTIWMADKPVLRPIGQYFLGLAMIFQRAAGGNTGYFMGEISNLGWKAYFPVVYLIKEPLTFHILTIIALFSLLLFIKKMVFLKPFIKSLFDWAKLHIAEIAAFIFIGIYWTTSLTSNLNIGVRHLLPVFPFTILLISGATIGWMNKTPLIKLKKAILLWLLLWQAYTVILIFPHFLAYFNESIGKTENGVNYVVDSNLDWGQELKRLNDWLDDKGIDKVYLDYFGGGVPEYYLGDKVEGWWGERDPKDLPRGSYLAVSATFLQGGKGKPIPNFNYTEGYYRWLDEYTPVEIIGYSIFIYYID